MADYTKMTNEEFDDILADLIHEESSTLLSIPGVYEATSEHFNNKILDIWESRQTEGKTYMEQHNVGRARYTVSYHDGIKTHDDGSPFFDLRIFKNKKSLSSFVVDLEKRGYSRS